MAKSIRAKIILVAISLLGAAVLLPAAIQWSCPNPARFACYFVLALLAAGLKVRLPGVNGTMSVTFLFTLLGVSELNLPQTLLMICSTATLQCTWRVQKRPTARQIVFNICLLSR